VDPEISKNKGSISVARDLSDADSFNGRTDIWINVWQGLVKNPIVLAFGTGPRMASQAMAQYFPANSPIGLFHNSLLGTLVSFGVLGLLLILLFIAFVAGSAYNLSFIDIKNADTLAIRMIPALLLFTLAEGMMEDFLFSYNSINIVWLWFMISAGFVMRLRKNGPETRDQ
jgi:O-antigen ligase